MRLSDDELAKLWLCRDFIFEKDLRIAQNSSNARTYMQLASAFISDRSVNADGDVDDISNKDTDAVLGKRSVD